MPVGEDEHICYFQDTSRWLKALHLFLVIQKHKYKGKSVDRAGVKENAQDNVEPGPRRDRAELASPWATKHIGCGRGIFPFAIFEQ